jgi:hypothetical protein
MNIDVYELNDLAKNNNDIDTDHDGLYDSVEAVLGTDFNNTDSDLDQLDDYNETFIYQTDPLEVDSNGDGLGDYFEVTNISLDLDNDSYSNAWDLDNDNDGVIDSLDMSPFTKSTMNDSFHFDIKTNGNPIYINFQLKPKNPDLLNLYMQSWDWPYDEEGTMKDLNNSKDDVQIIPMLELTVPSSGIYYKIIAKHSNKSLEVSNASQDDGANVQQHTYEGLDNQLWKLEIVEEGKYKIIAKHSGKVIEVNNASQDGGANVQQYTNAGNNSQLWEFVETAEDGYYKILANHSGKVLEVSNASQEDGANVFQNTSGNLDNQLWKLEPVVVGLPEQSVVEDYSIMIDLNKALIPLSPDQEYGRNAAFQGKMVYPESTPQNISVDANLVWLVIGKTDNESGGSIESKTTTLAQYKEDFMLTGFSIEENYGSNVSLFYSDDTNDTILGSLVMSYEFLKNSTNQLSDMPDELANRNLTMKSQNKSYRHPDGTLIALAGEMIPKALESFSDDRVIPIIAAVEENSTSRDMREVISGSYITESSYDLDMRNEPIITTRMLKMNWYNTTTNKTLDVLDTLSEMEIWGQANKLDDGTKDNVSAFVFELHAGDFTVISFDEKITDFDTPEWKDFVEFGIGIFGFVFDNMAKFNHKKWMNFKYPYDEVKKYQKFLEFEPGKNKWKNILNKIKTDRLGNKLAGMVEQNRRLATKSNRFGKISKTMDKIGRVAVGVTVLLIAYSEGWSAYGWGVGIATFLAGLVIDLVGTLVLSWALTGLGLAFATVGLIFAALVLIYEIFAWIFNWDSVFSTLMDWIVGGFFKKSPLTEAEPQMVDTSININDRNNNGLTENDRIELQSQMIGWINKTEHGNMYWVNKSDIDLSFKVQVSDNSVSQYGTSYEVGNWSYTEEDKSRLFNLGAWVEPKKKRNLKFEVELETDTTVFHEECFRLIWFDVSCNEKKDDAINTVEFATLYFDILTDNISEFAKWSEIDTQDPDGDSVSRMEVRLSTDPWNKDTDNDKLSDFEEHRGWNVDFTFFGEEFTQHVSSDPLINDTDGDGLTDFNEFLKNLNPQSQDTNGNG